jgi:hypothetical protein
MVGYSRLIGLDDQGTLNRLRALRHDVIDPAIARHDGNIVQTGGDSLLIVFDSIDGAVRCAMETQQQVPIHDADHPPDRAIRFRIGINIGDAIADGTDLHGDAVNVAARLQAECPSGGICVSRAVRDHVHGRLDLSFELLGTLSLKNISQPVEAFVVRLGERAAQPLPAGHIKSLLRKVRALRPSRAATSVISILAAAVLLWLYWPTGGQSANAIAVLPFVNMSAEPEQGYLAEAVTADLSTDQALLSSPTVLLRCMVTSQSMPDR